MGRKVYQADGAPTVGPYSHAVEAGDFVYLSGQTPTDLTTGKVVAGGVKEQTEQCFKNLFKVLEKVGLNSDDVVKVNVFLQDMKTFADMNEVYKKQFTPPYPARSTVGVAGLPLDAMVEIELIAKKR